MPERTARPGAWSHLFVLGLVVLVGAVLLVGGAALASGTSAKELGVTNTINIPNGTPTPCSLTWSVVNSPNVASNINTLNDVGVASSNDVWAVGSYFNGSVFQTLAEHWDGTAWSVVSSPNVGVSNNNLHGVAVASTNDVWAVGGPLILRWDGSAWSVVPGPNQGFLQGVAAVSANNVWAVGNYYNDGVTHTLVEHWDGTVWSVVSSPNGGTDVNYLYEVAAVSPTDMWAVGSYSDNRRLQTLTLVEHWDGTSWSVVPSPNGSTYRNSLYGVAAASANDVWAVGYYSHLNGPNQTLVEHWDGTSWSIVPSPNMDADSNNLNGVAVVSANDVWAVGEYRLGFTWRTLMEHWDGSAWSVVSSPNGGTSHSLLNKVAAASPNDIWAVGDHYVGNISQTLVEHYAPQCAPPTNTPTPTTTPLLTGHVTWQGRPAQPDPLQQLPITLTLKMGALEVNYPAQTTDASGFFTVAVTNLPNGTYNWRVKHPKYLANAGTTDFGVRNAECGNCNPRSAFRIPHSALHIVEMGLMRAGDCNNDNRVAISDFAIAKTAFGSAIGDPNYDDRADLNGDQRVSIVDTNLITVNFGIPGAPPIRSSP